MAKDKLVSPSFCYILAANFLLYFAFYLIMPILPFYLQEQFGADKSMIGFILSCYTIAALSIAICWTRLRVVRFICWPILFLWSFLQAISWPVS